MNTATKFTGKNNRTMPWFTKMHSSHRVYFAKALRQPKALSISSGAMISLRKEPRKKIKIKRSLGPLVLFILIRFGMKAVPDMYHLISRRI